MNHTLRLSPFALSLALVACNTPVGALVRVTDLTPGTTCPAGGEAI